MVLDHEIQKIRCFLLQRGINFLPEYILIHSRNNAIHYSWLPFHTEYICMEDIPHMINHISAFFCCNPINRAVSNRFLQSLMIILIQKCQRFRISVDRTQHLICINLQGVRKHPALNLHGLLQRLQSLFVD